MFLVGNVESPVRYHSIEARILTIVHYLEIEHCQVGSLTGAVAS
jgi:hypothetical protein